MSCSAICQLWGENPDRSVLVCRLMNHQMGFAWGFWAPSGSVINAAGLSHLPVGPVTSCWGPSILRTPAITGYIYSCFILTFLLELVFRLFSFFLLHFCSVLAAVTDCFGTGVWTSCYIHLWNYSSLIYLKYEMSSRWHRQCGFK